ncbi:MAG: DNA polymerase III subunit beta [Helicobacteraceae bacterium]|jgi:DNA polymerase-3 subunit beta|nr:DNA polymerase III subunit beta [Helicobacteraceae bacterium]
MKFAIAKPTLENMLSTLQPFLEKKDATLPTSHILFELKEGVLTLRATDNEIGLSVQTTEYEPQKEGSFTAGGKKILDVVRALNDDQILLEGDGESLQIKQNRSKYKLPAFETSYFPTTNPLFEKLTNQGEVTIDGVKLITALRKIAPAIATNNPKFELNGSLIDVRSSMINIVSTDTKRLAIYKIEQESDKNYSIIIPKKAISEIVKIFSSDLELYYDETNLVIKNKDYLFFTKVINGKFPDYERIIPRELKYSMLLETNKFSDAIKQISALSAEIKITFETGLISFETIQSAEKTEEAKTTFEAEITFESPLTIAVNSKFILDFLTQTQTEQFAIGINEPTTPFILRSESFSTIVMPIIL